MNKKVGSTVLVVLVFTLLLLPLVNTAFIKKDAQDLVGVSNETVMPQYTMETAFSGEFQKNFENSFSKGFEGYKFCQRLLNEIKFRAFKSVDNITVCKDNVLIFENYIQEYLCLAPQYVPSDEQIKSFTDEVSEINRLAEAKGKQVIVLITPSKAEFIADKIPERYYQMNRYGSFEDRGVEKLKVQLSEAGIPFVCSSDILKAQDYPFALFPDTGIHWTREAALTVYNEMANVIEQGGINLQRVGVTSRVIESVPRNTSLNNDADLWYLLNIFSKSDCEYSYPVEENIEGNYDRPNIFIQGGSFTFSIKDIIRDHYAANDCDFLFYNMSYYDESGTYHSVYDLHEEPIVQSVLNSDLIILEVNEEAVYNMGTGTYSTIINILSDSNIDSLYSTDVEYQNFNGVESYNGINWRWANSQYSSVVYKNVPEGTSLTCRFWIPYSFLIQKHPELIGSNASVEVYINGEYFDTISCQENQIFDISIPADRIIPNSDNTISFRAEYGLEQTAGQYVYFQLLSTGRY